MTRLILPWLVTASSYMGVREAPGAANNPVIVGWLIALKAWWRDDLTTWCGTFVAECFRVNGIGVPKHWYRAKAWLDWGVPLAAPMYGCVVIFERKGGGHVGFVVGRDDHGRLIVRGGNQSDKVCDAPFDMSRVLGYRAPPGYTLSETLPLVAFRGASSANEA